METDRDKLTAETEFSGVADTVGKYGLSSDLRQAFEIPGKHKPTDLGLIPESWHVVEIGDLNPFITSGSRGWARFYSDTGHPFIRITNLNRQSIYLDLSELKLVELPQLASVEAARTKMQDGDLLISITADIGIIGFVNSSLSKPAYMNQHIALVRFNHSLVSGKFVAYSLASESPQRLFLASMDVGAKAGMSLVTVRKLKIALPPPPEQHAIAEALSDVDALITSLDKFIAKKRAIKQAAMQQLLTGKTRLPGFSERWKSCTLGDLGSFSKGRGIKREDVSEEGVPCVRYGELYTRYKDYIITLDSKISKEVAATAQPIKTGDLLFAGSGETAEEIGQCAAYLGKDEVYAGGDIVILTVSEQNSLFLGHLVNHETVSAQKARFGQGDAVVHISARNLAQIKIDLPPVEEQTAIAAILSDMDAEITVLERRREKTKMIKQGMMQQLLTGWVRLINPSEEEMEPA